MKKKRTVAVLSAEGLSRLPLHIIVPITGWRPSFAACPWFLKLTPGKSNGLSKESGADAFQIRCVAAERFIKKVGALKADEVQEIGYRVALCIGLDPNWGGP